MELEYSYLAEKHLTSIEEYTRERWGDYQADTHLKHIENRILSLLETPYIGTERPEISNGCRCLSEGQHLILYRINGNVINILSVPHANMDLDKEMEHEKEKNREKHEDWER